MSDSPALCVTTIDAVFTVSGRGRALAFLMPSEGVVPRNGIVRTTHGDMPYPGVEFCDGPNGFSCLAVLVPDTPAARLLQPGEPISFHGRP